MEDEEEIGDCDAVISVTNNDERNLLSSLLVKQLGAKRVIARVAKVLNIPLFERVGIDIAVSPKTSAINEVRNDLDETDVDILATVEQGQAEVEFTKQMLAATAALRPTRLSFLPTLYF